jgi:hypothetical protein
MKHHNDDEILNIIKEAQDERHDNRSRGQIVTRHKDCIKKNMLLKAINRQKKKYSNSPFVLNAMDNIINEFWREKNDIRKR